MTVYIKLPFPDKDYKHAMNMLIEIKEKLDLEGWMEDEDGNEIL